MAGMGDLTRGTGNTHVMAHNKKLLCLEEGHWPWQIDTELNTVGVENFDGALTCSMTAHPKVCPVTGELIAFSYLSPEPPFLRYIRVSADGSRHSGRGHRHPEHGDDARLQRHREPRRVHGPPRCASTSERSSPALPFRFNRDAGARLGVMPRHGTNADVRWFEIDPCYVFHPVNAHEAGNTIVLHVLATAGGVRLEHRRLRRSRPTLALDDRPRRGQPSARSRSTIVRATSVASTTGRVGLDARYGYLMAMAGEGVSDEPVYGSALWKYDLRTGACDEHHLGEGVRGAEPVFAPASPKAGEDEGWVISLAHDTTSDESKLLIIDAQDFSAPPVATVHLPRRVPYGAHGSWVPDHVMS